MKNHPNPAAAAIAAIGIAKENRFLSNRRMTNRKKNAAESAITAAVLPQKRAHSTAAEKNSEKTASVLIFMRA